jgi:hypothetical protein
MTFRDGMRELRTQVPLGFEVSSAAIDEAASIRIAELEAEVADLKSRISPA